MKVFAGIPRDDIGKTPERASWVDELGYDGINTNEDFSSPYLASTLAAERGRDPATLTISVFGQATDTDRSRVDDFMNAGAQRVSVWLAHCDTEAEMGDQLKGMAETLIR